MYFTIRGIWNAKFLMFNSGCINLVFQKSFCCISLGFFLRSLIHVSDSDNEMMGRTGGVQVSFLVWQIQAKPLYIANLNFLPKFVNVPNEMCTN